MSNEAKPWIAIQVVMMPKDANPHPSIVMLPEGGQYALYSTIFGGVILSYIDTAGALAARRELLIRKGIEVGVLRDLLQVGWESGSTTPAPVGGAA